MWKIKKKISNYQTAKASLTVKKGQAGSLNVKNLSWRHLIFCFTLDIGLTFEKTEIFFKFSVYSAVLYIVQIKYTLHGHWIVVVRYTLFVLHIVPSLNSVTVLAGGFYYYMFSLWFNLVLSFIFSNFLLEWRPLVWKEKNT